MEEKKKCAAVSNCTVSADSLACRIREWRPFSPRWYSYKHKSAGVRYETCFSIERCSLAWVHGPFECGAFPDLKRFQLFINKNFEEGVRVIRDGSYSDVRRELPPDESNEQYKLYAIIRARHKTLNARLKNVFVLSDCFQHKPCLHAYSFQAVANITRLMLQGTNPLFQEHISYFWRFITPSYVVWKEISIFSDSLCKKVLLAVLFYL